MKRINKEKEDRKYPVLNCFKLLVELEKVIYAINNMIKEFEIAADTFGTLNTHTPY